MTPEEYQAKAEALGLDRGAFARKFSPDPKEWMYAGAMVDASVGLRLSAEKIGLSVEDLAHLNPVAAAGKKSGHPVKGAKKNGQAYAGNSAL
jgi:hypothetical protein